MEEKSWEEILTQGIEVTADGIIIADKSGRIVFTNTSAERLFGLGRDEIIGRTYHDLGSRISTSNGKPLPDKEQPFYKVLKEQLPLYEKEYVISRPDKIRIIVSINAIPVKNEKDSIFGVALSLRDITRAKQTEDERMELSEIIQQLMESTEEGIFGIDIKGRCTFINSSAIKMIGFDLEEVLGKSMHELIHHSHRDGTPYPAEECYVSRSYRMGQGIRVDTEVFWRKDGTFFPAIYSCHPLVDRGIIKGAIVTFSDITDRRQAEKGIQCLRALAEFSAVPVVLTDLHGNVTLFNKVAEDISGYPAEEILGKQNVIYSHEDSGALIETTLRDGSFTREVDLITKWKKKAPSIVSTFLIRDATGIPVEIGSIAFDISERKRAEELGRALNNINRSLISTFDFVKIMERVVVEAAEGIGSETAVALMREDDHWVVRYIYGMPEDMVGTSLADKEVKNIVIATRTKKPVVINDAYSDERINRELVEQYNIKSLLAIPLIVRDEVVGALSFNYHSTPVSFTQAQVDFASKLGALLSLVLENARLYTNEQNIANTLQEVLLTIPKRIPGIEFGHLYRSATEMARVGGDFYDLFELEHDNVGIVVGDVSGKGLAAATLTSLVKNTIKAYAYENDSPAVIMSKVNEMIRRTTAPAIFITVFFGIFNTRTGILTYCSAGHPPAIVKREGITSMLVTNSPAIGAFAGLNYLNDEEVLNYGDVLIIYTDGLTEARCKGEFFGEERLINFVNGLALINACELPGVIFGEVVDCTGGKLTDDLALLTIARQK